ncbi:hypothetical protein Val02_88310 [Virgisporangium aliadipatigenens]|uniref:Rv2525c-like glycoside hydrolase-like domain-containing protein n=1 Tax=Virgisporangium aliadipatigenens TaxID=741659 RepID=A0A8J3YY72_9ACTN|nr:glycoside hydrolase domain-containing protein [Virgisporangium aliadipatigenens]GIJ51945.1 hypothetical protein Val02_88310 [Virgisporangium aliadipatigenens]
MTGLSRRVVLGGLGAAAVGGAVGLGSGRPAFAATVRGIDYSYGRPRPSVIADAGYSFVCRYLSHNSSKNLSRSEADALRAEGLDIVCNWENTPSEALSGHSLGAANATEAHRQALACGMPASRPIYFSVDFDAQPGQQSAINAYFDGIASVLGRARTGAYGGYGVIDRLFDAGKISWGWQTYAWSGGNWDSRAQLRQVQNNLTLDGAAIDRDEARAADFGQWSRHAVSGTVSVYGFLADGRMTYTAIDADSGDRTHGAVTSSATLGFLPVAMATLNFNTILVTNAEGHLFRVDVLTNNNSLIFEPPVKIGEGWTHHHLAYDGYGHLFGIAGEDGQLRRYNVTTAKPTSIGGNTFIKAGFTLKTLTATGQDWILGTTNGGQLISYKINGPNDTPRYELRSTTWQVFDSLFSAGGGIYFGHKPEGSLHRYVDRDPFDGRSDDLVGAGTVDDAGWTQVLLSAQPRTVA